MNIAELIVSGKFDFSAGSAGFTFFSLFLVKCFKAQYGTASGRRRQVSLRFQVRLIKKDKSRETLSCKYMDIDRSQI